MSKWKVLGLVVAIGIIAAMVFPVFERSRDSVSPNTYCLRNVKNLALAVEMYVTDYDQVPDPRAWSDLLMPYVKNPDTFRCPQARKLRCGYAFNEGAVGANETLLQSPEGARLVTIFESDRGWNAHGGRELLPARPRYRGGENYAFLDGHVKWLKRGDTSVPMQWQIEVPSRPRGPADGH